MNDRQVTGSLRSGYTTGACAAAAARAAVFALLKQESVTRVDIDLPGAGLVGFEIKQCEYNSQVASCSVIKDAGDDPDVTDGAQIKATAILRQDPGVSITGGQGVGVVTKPGLEIPVGMAAINPVPRQMIEDSVSKVLQQNREIRGVNIIISVDGGEKLAKRTLNSRLGIVGGISILGTTGIVIPYSVDAYQASISKALDITVACGYHLVVMTTGRRSEKYAQNELKLPDECYIIVGDFIGYSLDECARKNISQVIIWGMTGKISKLAAGNFYTNVSDSRVDIGFLARVAADFGLPADTLKDLQEAVTANHLRRLLPENCVHEFCDRLCRIAAERCFERVKGKLKIECIMSDYNGCVLGRADAGK